MESRVSVRLSSTCEVCLLGHDCLLGRPMAACMSLYGCLVSAYCLSMLGTRTSPVYLCTIRMSVYRCEASITEVELLTIKFDSVRFGSAYESERFGSGSWRQTELTQIRGSVRFEPVRLNR